MFELHQITLKRAPLGLAPALLRSENCLDDLDHAPFNASGGLGKMWQLFGDQTQAIIDEINEALAA